VSDPIIGRRLFTDGSARDVYLAPDGRKYVVDDWGIPVFGVWILAERGEAGASFVVPTTNGP
jgi:hypothetical protein